MKKLIFVLTIAVIVLFSTCSSPEEKKHVILIGLDGWGTYCMDKADMPNIRQLMMNGAYTLKKRSVLPSSSAVNWASMFMGSCPELHGYTTWGSKTPEIPSRVIHKNNIFPTVFQLLKDQHPGSEIGCIYEWDGIKYLVDTLSLNYFEQVPATENTNMLTCEMAVNYIKEKKPDLFAVIFDEPDHVGHMIGHNTAEYYQKVRELDGFIGKIIQAAGDAGIYENTVFIITSDHGGLNKDHGNKSLEELETPFIISGYKIKKMGEFQESMMQFDVAPTIASVFGLKQPQVWVGRSMSQVFMNK
jgi:predicted AlkP superfamily pyrophosphatase or phosphodiesterase